MDISDKQLSESIYLPTNELTNGDEYMLSYIDKEFPACSTNGNNKNDDKFQTVVYNIPNVFQKSGERQACLAEEMVFHRLRNLNKIQAEDSNLWIAFFHNATYAGHSFRNSRIGKLMIREHDFVLFAKYKSKFYMVLMEVKSTNDIQTKREHLELEKISDSKVIKNNKRSAQHQLRDHLEVLHSILLKDIEDNEDANDNEKAKCNIQSYIMWPFLGAFTKSPNQQTIRRWTEDKNLHVFEDVINDQDRFNQWFMDVVLKSDMDLKERQFTILLKRYIILSCGVFLDEIHKKLLALLTQEQLELLQTNVALRKGYGSPLVVHGAAGTGKTLLVLRKLEQLYNTGRLNANNRALYICYWPGIREDFVMKLKKLGISEFVDTTRYFVSQLTFLARNTKNYRHIFMDETEAICIVFEEFVGRNTLNLIFEKYHKGNCKDPECDLNVKEWKSSKELTEIFQRHINAEIDWGELWFMVDINQASLFLPKYSPEILKTPDITLNKVMRNSRNILEFFKPFYSNPLPKMKKLMTQIDLPLIQCGHQINGPPIYWVDSSDSRLDQLVAMVVIDLCSTKGIKASDICVMPFMCNECLTVESVNRKIENEFVENGYRPKAVNDVELFLKKTELNDFLLIWPLRVKGLEFKVVILAIDDNDFDACDPEDRKKIYIISSRCTCLLIIVSNQSTRDNLNLNGLYQNYPFNLKMRY